MILDSPSIITPTTPTNKSTTPLVLGITCVKCKRSNVFSPILKALDKNIKVLVDAMQRINVMQVESEKHRSKIQNRKTK